MAGNFLKTLFRKPGQALREDAGSARAYDRMVDGADAERDRLGPKEASFISLRDSFYIASRTGDGWPYLQHRGGPRGFLKVIDDGRIGFADYSGNKQYLSTSNIMEDDRVALFLMDYANQRRLKLIGHARIAKTSDEPDIAKALRDPDYPAAIERFFVIEIVGFDWNCPQHITPRFTEEEVVERMAPLREENARLKAQLAALTDE